MQKTFLSIAFIVAALAVILGAFGAHGLKGRLTPEQLHTFEIGIRYHFYHTFALIIVALLFNKYNPAWLTYAAYAFIIGLFLFSGSLYLLANRELLGIMHWKWLGPLTPLGGLSFIMGWLFLLISLWTTGSK